MFEHERSLAYFIIHDFVILIEKKNGNYFIQVETKTCIIQFLSFSIQITLNFELRIIAAVTTPCHFLKS